MKKVTIKMSDEVFAELRGDVNMKHFMGELQPKYLLPDKLLAFIVFGMNKNYKEFELLPIKREEK